MVGGIKGVDTLVSTSHCTIGGFPPEFTAFSRISETSSRTSSAVFDADARADQEYRCVYSDTALPVWLTTLLDGIDGRVHEPIGLEVSQTSRAWSDGNARQFIIFDLWIKNISGSILREAAIGITVWTEIFNYDDFGRTDNSGTMCGFVGEAHVANEVMDTLNVAWIAHGSGLPHPGYTPYSPTAVVGYRILRSPSGPTSFNWWGRDAVGRLWGPHRNENARDYAFQVAWPYGDKAIYQLMTNGEIDYDNMYAVHDFGDAGWERPAIDPLFVEDLASGRTGQFLHLSCGPIPDIAPGDSVPFTYAVIIGRDFHSKPDNFATNFDPNDPQRYRENLGFSNLINTARAADWFFDNPGVDTDSDGYAGKYYLDNCAERDMGPCDTVWYKGDGIPDWGGHKGPPSPALDLTFQPGRVVVRWTGEVSETTVDPLSGRRDFEGYRAYISRVNTVGQYALIAAWDIPDNFYRLAYDSPRGQWRQVSYPQTTAQWRRELGDPSFDPSLYAHPSLVNGYHDVLFDTIRDPSGAIIGITETARVSYWAPQGPNQGNTYPDGGRLYDNQIQRIAVRDSVIGEDTLSYGVYELTMENLSAPVPQWFTITAFDHGDYRRNVHPLEGGVGANAQFAFPVNSADVVADSGLRVSVYPNPYKSEFTDAQGRRANYYTQGFEGYGLPRMNERERRIWFINLPDTADIRIYSLDGDLIREIHHPDPFLTRYSSVVGWDLISRNTQAVVSGIYIWRVDSRLGSQVGKIVIIK